MFSSLLANHTAGCSMIGYWHDTVCLSVTLCIVTLRVSAEG